MRGFPELLHTANRFHRELSTAHFLDTIVTTNWDTYFEDFAAATPLVIPDDYAYWDLEGRKVFKLHGSMHNLSTIVATEHDYDLCYRRLRTGAIGSTFKHLLATRRVVFIGYSFGDPDLNRILRFMRRELRDVLPRSFLVTPHGYEGIDFPAERVLQTDGTYFIRKLKDAAMDLQLMLPDSIYGHMHRLAIRVSRAHSRTSRIKLQEAPSVVHALAYQDGLLHSLDRFEALQSSGLYSNPHSTHTRIHSYQRLFKAAVRRRDYNDAAYILGYQNGLISLELDPEETAFLPLYYVWGSKQDILDFGAFTRELKRAPKLHKGATAQATKIVRDIGTGLTLQHPPFINTSLE
jgi:hypothetical protein